MSSLIDEYKDTYTPDDIVSRWYHVKDRLNEAIYKDRINGELNTNINDIIQKLEQYIKLYSEFEFLIDTKNYRCRAVNGNYRGSKRCEDTASSNLYNALSFIFYILNNKNIYKLNNEQENKLQDIIEQQIFVVLNRIYEYKIQFGTQLKTQNADDTVLNTLNPTPTVRTPSWEQDKIVSQQMLENRQDLTRKDNALLVPKGNTASMTSLFQRGQRGGTKRRRGYQNTRRKRKQTKR